MKHRKRNAKRTIVTFQPDKGWPIHMAVYDKAKGPTKYNPPITEHFKKK